MNKKNKIISLFLAVAFVVSNINIPFSTVYSDSSLDNMQVFNSSEEYMEATIQLQEKYPTSLNDTVEIPTIYSEKENNIIVENNEELKTATNKTVNDAKEYLQDEGYIVVNSDEDSVNIINPYQSKRLIILDDNITTGNGAKEILHYENEYILQYETVEDALLAYNQYKSDSTISQVFFDIVVSSDAIEDEIYPVGPDDLEGVTSNKSWGVKVMGLDILMDNLENEDYELQEVLVGVLDSGVTSTNPYLKGRLKMDLAFNTFNLSKDVSDGKGHGTHVSGTIVDGTTDNVMIVPIKVLDNNGKGTLLNVRNGIVYAIKNGVSAINISLSAEDFDNSITYLDSYFKQAIENDVVICCSAGNDYTDVSFYYPSNSPLVITVGAIDSSLAHASYSNTGEEIDFAAPGTRILSTYANGLAYMTGTSMATPHVTAAVALLKTWNKSLSVEEVKNILIENCVDLGAEGKDNKFGYGYINLADFDTSKSCEHEYISNVIKNPTCTDKGEMEYVCKKCGEKYSEDIPALGHDYQKTVINPTCEKNGYTENICSRCKDSYISDETLALGHNYIEEITRKATCEEEGLKTFTCQNCGDSYSETIPAIGHKYDAVITEEANCDHSGLITYTCENCGDVYTEEIPQKDHIFTEKTINPTCLEQGYTIYTCEDCGYSYKDNYVNALGHDYTLSETKEATCVEEGYNKYTCSRCDDMKKEIIPKVNHDYIAKITEPTCVDAGYTTFTCSYCGDSYISDNVDALGHDYIDEIISPTCTEDGYTSHTCSRCEDHYVDSIIKALGHDYEMTVTSATCTEDGKIDYVCSRCNDSYSTVIPSAGHSYITERIEPTCTENGYIKKTCSVCGDSYIEETLKALGHNFIDKIIEPTCQAEGYTLHICTICGEETKTNEVPKLEHKFTFEVVKQPTCIDKGEGKYTCTLCGYSYIEPIDAKGHSIKIEVIDPTCESKGYTRYYCENCDYEEIKDIINAYGHDYKSEITKEATCLEPGIITYTCSRCDKSYTEEIPVTQHSYEIKVIDPTCIAEGYTLYTCKICGESYKDNIISAIPHDYESEIIEQPTCDTVGTIKYTCKYCGKSYTEEIPVAEHHFTTKVIAPTCKEEGYTLYTCEDCGYSYKDNYTDKVEHNYISEITKEATCENKGEITYTCSFCGESYVEELDALGHDYKVTVVSATCEHGGYTEYKCSRCDKSYKTDETPVTSHEYIAEITEQATCGKSGLKTYTCKHCGTSYTEEIPALEHQYVSTIIEPTCKEEGYTEHTCSICGDSYKDTITEKIPHNFITTTIKPTIITKGYDKHVCDMCGYTYKDNYVSQMTVVIKTVNKIIDFISGLFN